MKPIGLACAQKVCRNLPPLLAQRLRAWLYPSARAARDDYEFTVCSQTGSLFRNRTSDFHGYPFSVHGYYEWRNWAVALALCSPGDAIVEVGANIGTETVGFADIVGPEGRVYAFEPLPSNLSALRETLDLNGQGQVTVLPAAVGAECRRLRFCLPPSKRQSGMGHLLGAGASGGPAATVEVDCVTLDSVMERLRPVQAVFIDAEGSEVMVLRGARGLIARDAPAIVLEASPRHLARQGTSIEALRAEIEALGYQALAITRLGLRSVDRGDLSRPANWLCFHGGKPQTIRAVRKSLRRCGLLPCVPGLNPLRVGRTS